MLKFALLEGQIDILKTIKQIDHINKNQIIICSFFYYFYFYDLFINFSFFKFHIGKKKGNNCYCLIHFC